MEATLICLVPLGIFGAGVFAGYMLARYRVRFEPREGFEPGARATGERGWQP